MTFFCDRCGQSVEAEDAWAGQDSECPACGNPLRIPSGPGPTNASASRAAGTSNCPSCGVELGAKNVLCIACGYDLRSGKKLSTNARTSNTQASNARTWEPPLNRDRCPLCGSDRIRKLNPYEFRRWLRDGIPDHPDENGLLRLISAAPTIFIPSLRPMRCLACRREWNPRASSLVCCIVLCLSIFTFLVGVSMVGAGYSSMQSGNWGMPVVGVTVVGGSVILFLRYLRLLVTRISEVVTMVSCPNCSKQTPRGRLPEGRIMVAICFFPWGLLALRAGRKPTTCQHCGTMWKA